MDVGGTIPLLLLFMIAPAAVLKVFGGSYGQGSSWLRILLIGQCVNVSVGAAGFVLIMVGRTGWDLLIYALSFLLDLTIALVLVPGHGAEGAAIAQATALVFSNALRLWLVWRFVRIQPYDRYYARLLIPTAVGAIVMIAVHSVTAGPKWGVDLLATGVIGGAAYYPSRCCSSASRRRRSTACWALSARSARSRTRSWPVTLVRGSLLRLGVVERDDVGVVVHGDEPLAPFDLALEDPDARLNVLELLEQLIALLEELVQGDPELGIGACRIAGHLERGRAMFVPASAELRGHPALQPPTVCSCEHGGRGEHDGGHEAGPNPKGGRRGDHGVLHRSGRVA